MSLLYSSRSTDRWCEWLGVALLALASAPWRRLPANPLALATLLYCLWQFASAAFFTPVYTAEGLYLPLVLLGAFAAFVTLRREHAAQLFGAGIAMVSALVLLGLAQHFAGVWHLEFDAWRLAENPLRAAATFVTPNSFATAIVMFLAPAACLYVVGGSRRWLTLALWLFAGLIATQSRGGMLALLAALAFAALGLGIAALKTNRWRFLHLLAGCAVVLLVVQGAGMLDMPSRPAATFEPAASQAGVPVSPFGLERGVAERPELYAAAFGFIRERPLAGFGANTFYPLFESVKPAPLASGNYYYAHDDYLQAWVEFGAPGIALLLAMVVAALVMARRAWRHAPGDPLPLVCGAALAGAFAHAVVDFPLYIPFVLLLVGAYLGALAAHVGDDSRSWAIGLADRARATLSTSIRWTLALAGLAWLAQPVIAEVALHRSVALLARGEAADGIYWQSVARRFEPRHPVHYWAEALIWQSQAMLTGNSRFAAEADRLFEQGTRVNRYDVLNLIGRSGLHRRQRALLENAAAPAAILSWAERAAALRPRYLPAQAELARALAFAGERERARRLARSLLAQYPQSIAVQRLAAEL